MNGLPGSDTAQHLHTLGELLLILFAFASTIITIIVTNRLNAAKLTDVGKDVTEIKKDVKIVNGRVRKHSRQIAKIQGTCAAFHGGQVAAFYADDGGMGEENEGG